MNGHGAESVSVKSYVLGFFLSLLLTLSAFFLAAKHLFPGWFAVVVLFGALQAAIQLLCFLHLGKEKKPRWNLAVFFFMLTVLIIIVAGSLFIMFSLNYRLMPKS